MDPASSDKVPTGVSYHKTEGSDQGFSGEGKSRSKGSEAGMKASVQGPGQNCPCSTEDWHVGSPRGPRSQWLCKSGEESGLDPEVMEGSQAGM